MLDSPRHDYDVPDDDRRDAGVEPGRRASVI
jgi:hypothetical protein